MSSCSVAVDVSVGRTLDLCLGSKSAADVLNVAFCAAAAVSMLWVSGTLL